MTNIFDMPLDGLQRFQRGDPLTADRLNQTIDAENSRRGVALPKQHRRPGGGGGGAAAVGGGSLVRMFEVRSISDDGDTLTCNTVPPTETEDGTIIDVTIARPPWLMQKGYNGNDVGGILYSYEEGSQGIVRTATPVPPQAGRVEQQIVARPYTVGEFIFAAKVGRVFVPFSDTAEQLAEDVVWQDLGNSRDFVQDGFMAE